MEWLDLRTDTHMTELGDKLRAIRQRAIDSGAIVPGETQMSIERVLSDMRERFSSANDVPVERAMIRRDEWDAVVAHIDRLAGRVAASASLLYGAPHSPECICPMCGLRHGGRNLDGGF